MKYLNKVLLAFGAWAAILFGEEALERLDGIVAVVGDSAVLLSELEAYTFLKLNSMGLSPEKVNFEEFQKQALEELVDGKVLLVKAEADSTISVTEDEVDDAVERQIRAFLAANNGTMEQLEEELRTRQGISLSEFRKQLRKNFRENLLKQKIQQRHMGQIEVSKKEVADFFSTYRDSLPPLGESVRISRLEIQITAGDSARQMAYEKIQSFKKRLDGGEAFDSLIALSDGPNAAAGGDLGYIGKGTLGELKFEQVIFSLSPNQVSEPFETRLGWHIVKVLDKREQEVRVKQIFVSLAPEKTREERVKSIMDSLYQIVATEEEFARAVDAFSTDPILRARGGRLGWKTVPSLDEKTAAAIDTLGVGTLARPFMDGEAYVLLRLNERVEDRPYDLDVDYALLAEQTKNIAAQKKLIGLVDKWKSETFIELRL